MPAIADVFRHPKYGVVSYQPNPHLPITSTICVLDVDGGFHYVDEDECIFEDVTMDEIRDYWIRVGD